MSIKVKIKKLSPEVELPKYATQGSVGFDIIVHSFKKKYPAESKGNLEMEVDQNVTTLLLTPGSRVLVGTGYSVELPEGSELQIRSRSGKALKEGLIVLNSPGTVDTDYRGEIGAILCNTSKFAVEISIGDKVAQAVLGPAKQAEWEEVEVLTETDRGAGGFGSTDKSVTSQP